MERAVALLTLVLLLVSLPTFASSSNSFAFNGSANSVAATQQISQGSGGPFSYSSFVGDAGDTFGNCIVGQLCTSSAVIVPISILPVDIPVVTSSGCLGSVCSALDVGVTGSLALIYNFSFMTPNLKDGTPFSFTVPLQVNGVVTALGPNGFLQKLWTVDFTAKGTATFIGFASSGAITFDEANFSYSGTATVVPEPTTLLLSGSGMVAVYWRSRRKFRG